MDIQTSRIVSSVCPLRGNCHSKYRVARLGAYLMRLCTSPFSKVVRKRHQYFSISTRITCQESVENSFWFVNNFVTICFRLLRLARLQTHLQACLTTCLFWGLKLVQKGGKMGKKSPKMGHLGLKKIIQGIIFKGNIKSLISCQNDQCIEPIIFCKLDPFWAAFWTKKLFPSQNHDFENGVFVKISKS